MNLMEQPLLIVFGGVTLITILIGGFIQTGKRPILYGAAAVLLLTIGLLGLERTTITPHEAVRATLFVIADDLKHNYVESVVEHISPGRPELIQQARNYMGMVEIFEVDIKRNLRIEIYEEKGMEIAEAKFNVVFKAKDKRGFLDEKRPIPRFFTVRFKNEDGAWRVRNYEMADPRDGLGGT